MLYYNIQLYVLNAVLTCSPPGSSNLKLYFLSKSFSQLRISSFIDTLTSSPSSSSPSSSSPPPPRPLPPPLPPPLLPPPPPPPPLPLGFLSLRNKLVSCVWGRNRQHFVHIYICTYILHINTVHMYIYIILIYSIYCTYSTYVYNIYTCTKCDFVFASFSRIQCTVSYQGAYQNDHQPSLIQTVVLKIRYSPM